MKSPQLIAIALAASTFSAPAPATDVGVSISIGQPGFYGRLDIGGYPPPALVFAEPILVERVSVYRAPVYLHVPPGHAKHWSKHCHEYRACGERVYFVRDEWYEREYVPRYRQRHSEGRGHDRDDRGPHGNSRHDEPGRDHGKGPGEGHGKGHGKDR